MNKKIPILGFCAYSGTGKTTLLRQLIPVLNKQGLELGVIKHAHHHFDVDKPGKDSYELRKAGAQQMLVSSSRRYALIHEHMKPNAEPDLHELLALLDHSMLDLILVEGFKHEAFPKIELHRQALNKPYLYTEDKNVIALASDTSAPPQCTIPFLDLNDIEMIGSFIQERVIMPFLQEQG